MLCVLSIQEKLHDSLGRNYDVLACDVPLKKVLGYLHITVTLEEGPKIRLDEDDTVEDWIDAAFSFYKGKKYLKNAPVRIVMMNQPVVDAGGVSRLFFSEVL